jgi:hypothetical protein
MVTRFFKRPISKRCRSAGFASDIQISLTDNRYKVLTQNKGRTWALYDLIDDRRETKDLASVKSETLKSMVSTLEEWRASCKASLAGKDYPHSNVPD